MSTWSVNISNPMIFGIAAVLYSTGTAVNFQYFQYAKEKNLGFVPNCRILEGLGDPTAGGWKSRYSLRTGCVGKGHWGRPSCFETTVRFIKTRSYQFFEESCVMMSHRFHPGLVMMTFKSYRMKVFDLSVLCTNWSTRYTISEFIHWKLISWLVPIGFQI